MNVNGQRMRTIWQEDNPLEVKIIDQRYLPHELKIVSLSTCDEAAAAIQEMWVRGAPLIGATAGFGMYLASLEAPKDESFMTYLQAKAQQLAETRPTAVNLQWAIDRQLKTAASQSDPNNVPSALLVEAREIVEEDVEICRMIGVHGLPLIEKISQEKQGATVNVLTHCNAGWLATSDWGTATSPIYHAYEKGIDVHVWVDETRPRNQGASLTAWELGQHGVQHTVIVDNTGGHLMQHGMVDLVITGTDRTTRSGDVANKIGTYLKALAAKDNNIPFYIGLPSSSIDWQMRDGIKEIPIETRSEEEVKYIQGMVDGEQKKVLLTPASSPAVNYGFDVTPSRLVTGLITERGICAASEAGLLELFPEQAVVATNN